MAIDEELLRPSRERLAELGAQMEALWEETHQKIERYGRTDREFARDRWREYWQAIEPLQREREAVLKVMTEYYNLQAAPQPVFLEQ